jgi:putative membrane protein
MMVALRLIVLGAIAIGLLTVALANRDMVTLRLLPEDVAALVGMNRAAEVPLYLVIFGGVVVGILIGFVWEWLREHRYRAAAAANGRAVARLERRLAEAGASPAERPDEVLALLDTPRKTG